MEKKRFETPPHMLYAPERATQVAGQLFGVRLPIFNFKFY